MIGSLFSILLITLPHQLSQVGMAKFLIYCAFPPSLLGEGGKHMR